MQLFVVIVVMVLTLTKTIDAQKIVDKSSSKSPYGYYDKDYMCFRGPPSNFQLPVKSTCQAPKIRREIEYALAKYPAVKESLKSMSLKCNTAYVNDIGLEETCPTDLRRATEVYVGREKCYVAKPYYQCATFAVCQGTSNCAGYLKYPYYSTCLYDGFRYFRVWVYCRSCGFKLMKLKLPQCCSCRKYKICGGKKDGKDKIAAQRTTA